MSDKKKKKKSKKISKDCSKDDNKLMEVEQTSLILNEQKN